MGLTINNSQSLGLLNIISSISSKQTTLMKQLSTGKKINSASDNPAGLIVSTNMNAEMTSVDAAISNGQRADSMMSVADGAMTQLSSLLSQIQTLASASTNQAGLSAGELAANQAQIDQAITSIDRIVGTTSFNGQRLLDGSQSVRSSGVDATKISDVKIYSRDSNATSTTINVALGAAAAKATKTGYATTSAASATKISVTGKLGSAVIDIATGDNLSAVAKKINDATSQTGVTASATAANTNLSLLSSGYGTDEFVLVQNVSGDATNYADSAKVAGTDASVTVNGQAASVDGLNVSFNGGGVSLSFNLTAGYNDGTVTGAGSFTVDDGGATFQLGTDSSTRSTVGIAALFSDRLGNGTTGYLSSIKSGGANALTKDPTKTVAIIKQAATDIAMAQARVGGFQKYEVKTTLANLQSTKESLASAKDSIENVDYAQATSDLNQQQILMNAALSLLGVSNNQASSILSLLN